ncbi:MAG: T9SS type A sorting domain-containing protein [Saprospiraceae bacterium]|nr:T9SS type A sorting domain-containing protein [Saprospiraceae bacterium]
MFKEIGNFLKIRVVLIHIRTIIDVTGKLVADSKSIQTGILQFSGERTFHLECVLSGKLNSGLYLIRLTDEDGTTSFTEKWIVY